MTLALKYYGGKYRIAPWIVQNLPPHICYCEPFCGAASVLFQKPRSKVEVINDLAGEIVNFFTVARDSAGELIRVLEWTPFAAAELVKAHEPTGDPVEKARRFFLRSWATHSGTRGIDRKRGFRRSADRDTAGYFVNAVSQLKTIRDRLQGVLIDSLDYSEILRRYDRPETCFYVDPPYPLASRSSPYPSDGYGPYDLTDTEHETLLKRLNEVEGSVVLSGYDHPLYDEHLSTWSRLTKRTTNARTRPTVEVLWVKSPQGEQSSLFSQFSAKSSVVE